MVLLLVDDENSTFWQPGGERVAKGWRVAGGSGPRWKDVRFFDFQSNGAFKLQKGGTFGSACQNLSPMLSSMSGAIQPSPKG